MGRMFYFDIVTLGNFCFCCLCFWSHIQKIIAETNVKELFSYVFSYGFYSFMSYVQTFNPCGGSFCKWYKTGVQFNFMHMIIQFPCSIYWRLYCFLIEYSWLPCQVLTCFLENHMCSKTYEYLEAEFTKFSARSNEKCMRKGKNQCQFLGYWHDQKDDG